MMKKAYFLCAPNLGTLDNWLPVLYKLRKEGYSLVCIVPKAGTMHSFALSNVLTKISLEIFDQIVYKTHSDHWAVTEFSLATIKANALTRLKIVYIKIKALSPRNRWLLPFGLFVKYIVFILDRTKIRHVSRKIHLNSRNSVLLYDVSEEKKKYNLEILQELQSTPKFSLYHGVSVGYENSQICKNNVDNITIFSHTSQSKREYLESYSFLTSDMVKVVGVPKYERWWIDKLIGESNIPKNGYVFLISRAVNSYFSIDMKLKAANDIKKFVVGKMHLKLIIKRHPKEIIGDSVFEDIFGIENYGNTWEYSDQHAFAIGNKCLFAISFYSGVVVDMIAINKPTIEYIDLKGLDEFDNQHSLRIDGEPVFNYRYLGLTLGASNGVEFKACLNKITNDPETVVSNLVASFNGLSLHTENSTDFICSNIARELENEK